MLAHTLTHTHSHTRSRGDQQLTWERQSAAPTSPDIRTQKLAAAADHSAPHKHTPAHALAPLELCLDGAVTAMHFEKGALQEAVVSTTSSSLWYVHLGQRLQVCVCVCV